MLKLFLASGLLFLPQMATATTWPWLSAEDHVQTAALIAIVNIGPIHQVFTPEGILLQSATAVVEKVFYNRFSEDEPVPEKVAVYALEPNALVEDGMASPTTALTLREGRCFVMLQMRGHWKLLPYSPTSIQPLGKDDMVIWPTAHGKMEHVHLPLAVEKIKSITEALPKENQAPQTSPIR